MKKNKLIALTLAELSAVRKPAMEGATIDVTKGDDRVVIFKAAAEIPSDDQPERCPTCKQPITKSAKHCADCGMKLAKADPTTEKKNMPTELEKELAAKLAKAEADKTVAETALAKAHKLNELNDVQRLHYKRLDADGQTAFLAKSGAERAKDCEPVYKTADGIIFTSADDQRTIDMAKSFDKREKESQERLEKADAVVLEKRAETELAHLPGTVQERAALLKAAEGIADEKLRTGAIAALHAHDTTVAKAFKRQGISAKVNPDATGLTAEQKLDKMAQEYATANKVDLAKAMDAVLETEAGGELYSQIPVPGAIN